MRGLSIPRIAELVRPLLRLPVVYRNAAASTAITGATEADTIFDTNYTIPANTLRVGSLIRIRALVRSTATTLSEADVTALKIGSTTICSTGNRDPADGDLAYFDVDVIVRETGAAAAIWVSGAKQHGVPFTVTMRPFFTASLTIDTTAANVVGVWMDRQASATDSDSAQVESIVVEVVY